MGARLALTLVSLAIATALEAAGGSYTPEEWRGFYGTVIFAFVVTIGYGLSLPRIKHFKPFAIANVATDIGIVSALVHLSGGSDSPFAFLYVLVAVYGAVLFERTGAMVCAIASLLSYGLVLLAGHQGWVTTRNIGAPDPVPVLISLWVVNGGGVILVATLAGFLSAELRRAGAALERKTSDLSRLLTLHQRTVESLMSGLLTTDTAGRITSFNPEAERITCRTQSEVVGLDVDDVLPGIRDLVIVGAEAGEIHRSRARMPFEVPDQGSRHFGVAAYVLRDGDTGKDGYVVIFQDVTDVVDMETCLRRSERLAAIGELSASIAHEIRNPLAAISGSIELLQSHRIGSGVPGDPEQLMRIVLRETDRLNHLITDFLEYARPGPRNLEPISLMEAVADVMEMFETARPDGIETKIEIEEGLAAFADAAQLRQVLWNLVINASQAMPEGGRLEVLAQTVAENGPQGGLVADRRGAEEEPKTRWMEIAVSDNGVGIPADQIERIFDPFFTTKQGGSGLGLATVHRIVEDHGGVVRMESTLGGGTTAYIRLPRAETSS
jgi:two-component system sensor histidine kinase PilS (NtrC family)